MLGGGGGRGDIVYIGHLEEVEVDRESDLINWETLDGN